MKQSPLWHLGFRPFFLLAALFAAVALALWLGVFFGGIRAAGFFQPLFWHAHEMIYGYATAVIAGFVLTASQNWTGIRGVHGTSLKLLVALWVAGRLGMSLVHAPSILVSLVDLAFYPALGLAMIPYLKPEDMKVERVFFLYFGLYFGGNLLMHLDALGFISEQSRRGALLGLFTTMMMIIFMGGRVIPFFTESELSRNQPRSYPKLEIAAHASAWAFLILQTLLPFGAFTAAISFLAAGIHLIRLYFWQVPRVRKIPLIWVLHLAYLWIVAGFALFGFVSLGMAALGPSVHAFTIGGLGMITYGMMSRVSLGHTGRKLHPSRVTVAGYVCLNLAALFRVFVPILAPRFYVWGVELSGALWISAFALFLAVYVPILAPPTSR